MKYIFGASGNGLVVLDILQSGGYFPDAFIDDIPMVESIEDIPVLNASAAIIERTTELIIAVGNNLIRKQLSERFKNTYYVAIHPSAVISSTSRIGEGSVIMAGAVLNARAFVGAHCIINTNSVIDHECIVDEFVHVSPNATLCGNVHVGVGTHVGAGAVIIQNIKVGKWAVIGAGTVVIRDVPDYATVVGNPARVIK